MERDGFWVGAVVLLNPSEEDLVMFRAGYGWVVDDIGTE
jgi:hypothetical protein